MPEAAQKIATPYLRPKVADVAKRSARKAGRAAHAINALAQLMNRMLIDDACEGGEIHEKWRSDYYRGALLDAIELLSEEAESNLDYVEDYLHPGGHTMIDTDERVDAIATDTRFTLREATELFRGLAEEQFDRAEGPTRTEWEAIAAAAASALSQNGDNA